METAKNILSMKNITKIYGNGIVANSHVDFSVQKGEIHALMGENGAGKSTLMKILFGIEQPDEGTIELKGQSIKISSPDVALHAGVGMVHQHFKLVPSLTVAENIVLGKEPKKHGLLDKKEAVATVKALSEKFGFDVDPQETVSNLSVGKKQKVEILKSLYRKVELLILDEPTAVLTPQETEELFVQLEKLKNDGLTIIFISHKLNEIKQICQRITIMRHGRGVGTYEVDKLTIEEISKLMVGRDIILKVEKTPAQPKETRLEVKDVSSKNESGRQMLSHVSFSLREGEILGIAGVEGSGQEDIVQLITGIKNRGNSGQILLGGRDIKGARIRDIRRSGMAYIPEDRMTMGVAEHVSIQENLISSIYDTDTVNTGILADKKKVKTWVDSAVEDYDIRCGSPKDEVSMLSGGNMQKVVIAREFMTKPSVLVADQPTRGVDVGSIEFIHKKIVEIRDKGCAVLLVSADLNEILELADSIIVMHQGAIAAYFPSTSDLSEEELGYYMLGVKKQTEQEIRRACCEK